MADILVLKGDTCITASIHMFSWRIVIYARLRIVDLANQYSVSVVSELLVTIYSFIPYFQGLCQPFLNQYIVSFKKSRAPWARGGVFCIAAQSKPAAFAVLLPLDFCPIQRGQFNNGPCRGEGRGHQTIAALPCHVTGSTLWSKEPVLKSANFSSVDEHPCRPDFVRFSL